MIHLQDNNLERISRSLANFITSHGLTVEGVTNAYKIGAAIGLVKYIRRTIPDTSLTDAIHLTELISGRVLSSATALRTGRPMHSRLPHCEGFLAEK